MCILLLLSAGLVAGVVFEIVLIIESSCLQPQTCATKAQAKGMNLNRGVFDIVTNDLLRKFLVFKHFQN